VNQVMYKISAITLFIMVLILPFNLQLCVVGKIFRVKNYIMPPMKGMTINAWSAEAYNSSNFDQSIMNLASIKANWVTFTVFWFMEHYNDVEMHPRPDLYTASDSSLAYAIQKTHELGMKVALKPMIDVVDQTWRGQINPVNWTLWFSNYRNFINYYADFATANNVELFEVGTELRSSQPYELEWRNVISEVRLHFNGNITYAANWDSYSIYAPLTQYAVKFWDALDYVGVDAYFPLTNLYNPTVQQLINAWSLAASGWWGSGRNWTNELYLTYLQTGKKIIFTEIGYCSQNGANIQPWNWNFSPTVDLQEQADCYQAALEVFKNKPWFEGWFWWSWETDPDAGGPSDKHYTPQNKPAQNVLMQYYCEPDIAILDIACSKNIVGVGSTVNINVTIENQGVNTEIFNLTLYANLTSISSQTISLSGRDSAKALFVWDTTGFSIGNYTISAYVWPIEGELDTDDNLYVDGIVQVAAPVRDVAITNLSFSKEHPRVNESIEIFVEIVNNGNIKEIFEMNLNYTLIVDPLIGRRIVVLDSEESVIISFVWTPTCVGRYEIKAYTSEISEDINPQDNTKTNYIFVCSNFFSALESNKMKDEFTNFFTITLGFDEIIALEG